MALYAAENAGLSGEVWIMCEAKPQRVPLGNIWPVESARAEVVTCMFATGSLAEFYSVAHTYYSLQEIDADSL
jgi:hypothetical protein